MFGVLVCVLFLSNTLIENSSLDLSELQALSTQLRKAPKLCLRHFFPYTSEIISNYKWKK